MRLLLLCFVLGTLHTITLPHPSGGATSSQSPELVDKAHKTETTGLLDLRGQSQEGTPLPFTAVVVEKYLEELPNAFLTKARDLINDAAEISISAAANQIENLGFPPGSPLVSNFNDLKFGDLNDVVKNIIADWKNNAESIHPAVRAHFERKSKALAEMIFNLISNPEPGMADDSSDVNRKELSRNIMSFFGRRNWFENVYISLWPILTEKLQQICYSKVDEFREKLDKTLPDFFKQFYILPLELYKTALCKVSLPDKVRGQFMDMGKTFALRIEPILMVQVVKLLQEKVTFEKQES